MRRKAKAILATSIVALILLFAFLVPIVFSGIQVTCVTPSGSGIGTVYQHYGSITYAYLGFGGVYGTASNFAPWLYSVVRDPPPQHNSTC